MNYPNLASYGKTAGALLLIGATAAGCASSSRVSRVEYGLNNLRNHHAITRGIAQDNSQRIANVEQKVQNVEASTQGLTRQVARLSETPYDFKVLKQGMGNDKEFGYILGLVIEQYKDKVLASQAEKFANALIIGITPSDYYNMTPVRISDGKITRTYNDLDVQGDVTAFAVEKKKVPQTVQQRIPTLETLVLR